MMSDWLPAMPWEAYLVCDAIPLFSLLQVLDFPEIL